MSLEPEAASSYIDLKLLEAQLSRKIAGPLHIEKISPVEGGDISKAFKVQCKLKPFFLKLHRQSMYPMLQSEARNLEALAKTKTLRIPLPIAHGLIGTHCYLLLEFLDLHRCGPGAALGSQLARLHQHTENYCGWFEDNWIGTTSQPNTKCTDWVSFWRHRRLAHQLSLAKDNGAPHTLLEHGEHLLCDMDGLFANYSPESSLLHGDLWLGNFAFDAKARPVVYDPACYYGDRETDLAMTELFGGFSQEFYSAYMEALPLDEGYRIRKDFYNLYHVLNHFNLFGGSYARQAEQTCLKVLSELR